MIESQREFRIRPTKTDQKTQGERPIQEPPPRRDHVLDETKVLTRKAGERPSEERAREEATARPAESDAAIDRGETWIEEMKRGVAAAGKDKYLGEVLGFVGELAEGEPPVRAPRPLAPVQHIAEEPPPIRAGTTLVPPQEILDEPPSRRLASQERQAPEEGLGQLFDKVARLFSTGEDRKTVTPELIGHTIDLKGKQLRVEKFLGKGAMGLVYQVRDIADGSLSALKISHVYDHSMVSAKKEDDTRLSQSEKNGIHCARRLIHEIAALRCLTWSFDGTRHQPMERKGRQPPFPILLGAQFVHDPRQTTDRKRRTLVLEQLEYIEGHTLAAYLGRGRTLQEYPGQAVSWSLQLMEAVQQAHRRGVLHGDIKPNNIVITKQGDVILVDYDTAFIEKFGEGSERKGILWREKENVPMTPAYLSPHDFDSTEQRDIFATGRTIQLMIYGTEHVADLGQYLTDPERWNALNQRQLSYYVTQEGRLQPQLQVLSSRAREMTATRPEQRPRLQEMINKLRYELDLPTPQELAAAEQQAQTASA